MKLGTDAKSAEVIYFGLQYCRVAVCIERKLKRLPAPALFVQIPEPQRAAVHSRMKAERRHIDGEIERRGEPAYRIAFLRSVRDRGGRLKCKHVGPEPDGVDRWWHRR